MSYFLFKAYNISLYIYTTFFIICSADGHLGFFPLLGSVTNTVINIGVLAWAALTEYHKMGGLSNRNLFLTALEVGKSDIKLLAG